MPTESVASVQAPPSEASAAELEPGQVLAGPMFAEPVRVETVSANGAGSLTVGVVEIRSERFRRVVLTPADIARIEIGASIPTYEGDGARLRLGIQAHLLGIAYEYDPWFALSTSRVDPLPHQLDAVYNHLGQPPGGCSAGQTEASRRGEQCEQHAIRRQARTDETISRLGTVCDDRCRARKGVDSRRRQSVQSRDQELQELGASGGGVGEIGEAQSRDM